MSDPHQRTDAPTSKDPATSAAGEDTEQIRQDALRAFAFKVWNFKQGEMVSLMIHLGDRLGLYRSLEDRGPTTSDELARATDLDERWVREWLYGQAAAGLLTYWEPDRFELTGIGAEVLADEDNSLWFAAGAFTSPVDQNTLDQIAEAFQTGVGLTYQELGPCAAHRTERMLGPWARQALVPTILPALEGIAERLEEGIDVVDVGCGSGIALAVMAETYPKSRFVGYDPSAHAVERGHEAATLAGLDNLSFVIASGEELPAEPSFDFALTFDCLHDMTHPAKVSEAIRRTLRSDGTWLIKEIRCHERFVDNLRNPMLAMLYGFSITACMSSALSEPDGAGLGTLGLPPERLERMVRKAGFDSFETHDFDDPANLYYEVRVAV